MTQPQAVSIDGHLNSTLDSTDRGLHYGHGLFETMRVYENDVPLWALHRARLETGLQRLGIDTDLELLEQEWRRLLSPAVGLLKIILTAGSSGRGYGFEKPATARRLIFSHPEATQSSSNYLGVTVRICSTRLAPQPILAGVKHLNRLEQVLARAEWHDARIAEGLMLDQHDRLVDGTFSNLFVIRDGTLQTPLLEQCGVAGTLRAWLLEGFEGCPPRMEQNLTVSDLLMADECFLCNSIVGIWPICRLIRNGKPDSTFRVGTMTRMLQQRLHQEFGYPSPG